MNNEGYGDMSVDEWLQTFFMAATCDGTTFVGNEEVGIDEIKKELYKAVIREASVGVGTVRRAGDKPLPEAPLMFVPWETKDGDYDLILREVSND